MKDLGFCCLDRGDSTWIQESLGLAVRIPNFREVAAVKGLGHFWVILVVSWSWIIILRLHSFGLIEHLGLFPHRKSRSAMRLDSVLHFNTISGYSRISQSLGIDV